MAESVNFTVIQGDNFRFNIIYKDSNQEPVNLTGYSVLCSVRDTFGGKVRCATVSLGSGIIIIPEEGKIMIDFEPYQTLKFTVPKAVFQVQLIDPDEKKDTIAYGYLDVKKAAVNV